MMKGPSRNHLVQLLCQGRGEICFDQLTQECVQVNFKVSREGDNMTSMGSLFQCSANLYINKFFLVLRWKFLYFSSVHYSLSCHWEPLKASGTIFLALNFEIFEI